MSSDSAVLELCDEVWNWRLAESPETASFCGFHQYDDAWDDISDEAYKKREVKLCPLVNLEGLLFLHLKN